MKERCLSVLCVSSMQRCRLCLMLSVAQERSCRTLSVSAFNGRAACRFSGIIHCGFMSYHHDIFKNSFMHFHELSYKSVLFLCKQLFVFIY